MKRRSGKQSFPYHLCSEGNRITRRGTDPVLSSLVMLRNGDASNWPMVLEFRITSGNFSEINDTHSKKSLMVTTIASGSVVRQEEKYSPFNEMSHISHGYQDSERRFQIPKS